MPAWLPLCCGSVMPFSFARRDPQPDGSRWRGGGGTIRLIQVEDKLQSFPTIGVTGPPRHEAFPNRDARRNTAPTLWRAAGVSGDFAAGFIKGNTPRAHSTCRLKSTASHGRSRRIWTRISLRKNKPVDAAFPHYTPGFSADQRKFAPWRPISAREEGVYPPKYRTSA